MTDSTTGSRAMLRWLAWCALACVLLGACLGACQPSGASDDWVVVQRDTLVLGVDIEGALQAVDSQVIGPPVVADTWEFKIADMAPEGTEIEAGADVLVFDPTELLQKLQEKQNEAESARKELDKKRQSLRMARRDRELKLADARGQLAKAELQAEMPPETSARVDIRKAELAVDIARRQVAYLERKAVFEDRRDQAETSSLSDKLERAEARVREMMEYHARMTVKAPRAGTVIYTEDWDGNKKKVGDSVWRARSVLEIVSLDRMKADGMVAEMDASKVAVGQRVRLRLDALPDVEFSGQVTAIAETVQRKSPEIPVQVAHIDIALDETDSQRMRPGMRFRGTVETGRIEDAVMIPIDAVFIDEGGPVAYRATGGGDDDDYEIVKLDIGARNKTHVQVLSGLAQGDRVSLVDRARAGAGGGS